VAEIHRTTMTPTKLELVARWLPLQPWYDGRDEGPQLTRVGGFRLDDPDGEVGMEVLLVGDDAGGTRTTYCVPMTYRGAPLEGAEHALVGTSEHGVLGLRWLYDAPHDPVFVTQLVALLAGEAQPQHQTESHTPDPDVELVGPALLHLDATSFEVLPTPPYTSLAVRGTGETAEVLRLLRVVTPAATTDDVTAVRVRWETAEGTTESGPVVVAAQAPSG
jgi:hypothetical protein